VRKTAPGRRVLETELLWIELYPSPRQP